MILNYKMQYNKVLNCFNVLFDFLKETSWNLVETASKRLKVKSDNALIVASLTPLLKSKTSGLVLLLF
jgi:hypothetical protein